jgi:hypothetical protein
MSSEKVVARCGSCRGEFPAHFQGVSRPPPRCPRCYGNGTYWTDLAGVPLGIECSSATQRGPKDVIEESRTRKRVHSVHRQRRKSLNMDS